jgi:hypothetical protein
MRLIAVSSLLAFALAGCTITTTGQPYSYASRPVGTVATAGGACGNVCGAPMGCRTAVHRTYNPGSGEHFYTSTRGEGAGLGFNEEAANYFYLSSAPAPGLVPLHRCLMNYGKHFYTTAPNCEGVTPGTEEATMGFLSTTPQCGAVPLFRSYNPGSNDHFYTTDPVEHARATHGGGWNDEGITGYVWPSAG